MTISYAILLCEIIKRSGLGFSFPSPEHHGARLFVLQFPKFFSDLIEGVGCKEEFRRLFGEDDAADRIVTQHHVHWLLRVENLFELPLQVGDGDE